MNDDRDPRLLALFADTAPQDDPAFVAAVQARIDRARRVRAWQRGALLAGVLVGAWWSTPYVASVSVAAGEQFGALATSPAGWALSLLIGVWVVRRARG